MQTGHDTKKPIDMEIQPIRFGVVVKPDVVDDTSSGGIIVPPSVQEKQQYAIDRGTIMAMSENAFLDEGMWRTRPQVGDKVLYDKYAGAVIHRKEGREREILRLCNDTEILAILR